MDKIIIIGGLCVLLTGCGAVNAWTSASLTTASSDYAGAKSNLQKIDDGKFQGWEDEACLLNLGALQRSKNPNAVKAALFACPVANPNNLLQADPSGGIALPTAQ